MTHVGPRPAGPLLPTTERKTVDNEASTPGATPMSKREQLKELATSLANFTADIMPSREASLATTKLDEFYFWAASAVAMEEVAAQREAGE